MTVPRETDIKANGSFLGDHASVCKAVIEGKDDAGATISNDKAGGAIAGCAETLGKQVSELKVLAISDPNAQATMVARVIKNELSVRATEEAVKVFLEPRPIVEAEADAKPGVGAPRLRPVPDASVAELEHLLEDFLDTRVHVDLKGRNGRIIIDFADLDDLERLYIAIAKPK